MGVLYNDLLIERSMFEKRDLLGCLKSKISLKNKSVSIN
jgi:hypothetical protein